MFDGFDMSLALKAEASYQRAIEYNPKYSSAYKKLGILYQEIAENEATDDIRQEYTIKAFKSYIDLLLTKFNLLSGLSLC